MATGVQLKTSFDNSAVLKAVLQETHNEVSFLISSLL